MLDFPPSSEKSFLLSNVWSSGKLEKKYFVSVKNVLIALRIERHQKFRFCILNNVGVKSACSTVPCNKHAQNQLEASAFLLVP